MIQILSDQFLIVRFLVLLICEGEYEYILNKTGSPSNSKECKEV